MTPIEQNMKSIRMDKGLTQTTCSKRTGISKGTWSKYESDQRTPSLRTIDVIAGALEVPASEILLGHDGRHEQPEDPTKRPVALDRIIRNVKLLSPKDKRKVVEYTELLLFYEKGHEKGNA